MNRIAIATTTFYKSASEPRALCALKTADECVAHNIPLVVVDGGSPPEFLEQLVMDKDTGMVTVLPEVPHEPGKLGPGRRQAMAHAAELVGPDGVVIWTEAEKYPFIPFVDEVARSVLSGKIDLVIPACISRKSAPPEQAHAEQIGNLAVEYLLGQRFDFFFGPLVMNHRALQLHLGYKGDYGDSWDSVFIPRLRVMAAGLAVQSFPIAYVHPKEQTQEETGNMNYFAKRLTQLKTLVASLVTEVERLDIVGLYKSTPERV